MEGLVGNRIVRTDVVEARYFRFPAKFVDKLTLPKKHHVLLVLRGLLHFGCVHLPGLLFLDLENLAEGPAPELLDDLEPAIENLLPFL